MIKAVVFDAFGTLFNLELSTLSVNQDEKVKKIMAYVRQKQLEYSWLNSLMGHYIPFNEITIQVLEDAVKLYNGNERLVQELAQLYLQPVCFKDVLPTLQALSLPKGILSNGSVSMLNSGIDKNNIGEYLDFVLSADQVQIFKPNPRIYQLVLDTLKIEKKEVLFVSSNQWDVAGAASFGFHCAWVNRNRFSSESLLKGSKYSQLVSLDKLHNLIP